MPWHRPYCRTLTHILVFSSFIAIQWFNGAFPKSTVRISSTSSTEIHLNNSQCFLWTYSCPAISKSDYTHLCNSFSKSIHCKTDMLLIPPHSTSQNLFPFRSFVYLDLFISLFSPFPSHTHTQNPIPLKTTHKQVQSEMHMCKQKDTRAQEHKHTPLFRSPQLHKHTPLFISPQLRAHTHTHK